MEGPIYVIFIFTITCKSSDSEMGVREDHTMAVMILLAQRSLQACQSTHFFLKKVIIMSFLNLAIFHHCNYPSPQKILNLFSHHL